MQTAHVKITILVDNLVGEGLVVEHGLSFWIETNDQRILFDTGQGGALKNNAHALGVDLSKTDMLVLSHGHYDHTGGLPYVLQQAHNVHIYGHPGMVQPRYSMSDGTSKAIQMPRKSMMAIDKLPSKQLHWVQQPIFLSDKIGLTGPIPRETSFEDPGGPFYLNPEAKIADPIDDDLALWIRKDDELIVCVGCAHAGLVNTLNYIRSLNHGLRIRTVIGGFHLHNANRQRLDETIAALQQLDPDTVVACHCTGETAVDLLREKLGDRVSTGVAGMTYQF